MDILSHILLKWAGNDKVGAVELLLASDDENLVQRFRANLPPAEYAEFDALIAG